METSPVTVSVIMPCYNDGQYLQAAVDSLRSQTYPDVELIVIDDGSDDEVTLPLIQSLDFPRLQVLHTKHIGPAAARNCGIAAAKGEYILPLDADDTIEPTYIQRGVEVLQRRPGVGVVYCHADLFDGMTGPWALPDYSLETELLDNCIFVTALFRKADWEAVGGFCEDFRAGMEDYDFWLSLLELGREVHQLPETLFHYRIKPQSRTTRFNKSYADVQETYVRLYQRHRALYARHMDEYCMALRRNLIDQLLLNRQHQQDASDRAMQQAGDAQLLAMRDDPLVAYVMSVRRLKPGLARTLEKLLSLKDGVKRLIGRK